MGATSPGLPARCGWIRQVDLHGPMYTGQRWSASARPRGTAAGTTGGWCCAGAPGGRRCRAPRRGCCATTPSRPWACRSSPRCRSWVRCRRASAAPAPGRSGPASPMQHPFSSASKVVIRSRASEQSCATLGFHDDDSLEARQLVEASISLSGLLVLADHDPRCRHGPPLGHLGRGAGGVHPTVTAPTGPRPSGPAPIRCGFRSRPHGRPRTGQRAGQADMAGALVITAPR